MLVHLAAAFLQVATPAPAQSPPAAPASQPERDSTTRPHRDRKPPKRVQVTDAHRATAFRDPGARAILALDRKSVV